MQIEAILYAHKCHTSDKIKAKLSYKLETIYQVNLAKLSIQH